MPYSNYDQIIESLDSGGINVIGFSTPIELVIPNLYPESLIIPIAIPEIPRRNHYITFFEEKEEKVETRKKCTIGESEIREMIDEMKENVKRQINGKPPLKIDIHFNYNCNSDKESAMKRAGEYRDKLRKAIEFYKDTLIKTNTNYDKEVAFKDTYDKNGNFSDIYAKFIDKTDKSKYEKDGFKFIKKYTNSNLNITKINVYFNDSGSEYKVIPYAGKVPDYYHKILFTNKFEMFPLKKI
jgi:hypothetical protein